MRCQSTGKSSGETSIADGKEEIFEHRGVEVEEEMEDVGTDLCQIAQICSEHMAVAAEREESIFEREVAEVSVADRVQNIESVLTLTSSATAAGSVDLPPCR